MPGEFNAEVDKIEIQVGGEEEEEVDEEKESLRTQVSDLQRNLEIVRTELAMSRAREQKLNVIVEKDLKYEVNMNPQ